ncbi:MAG: methyltransferase domain-containing protein [Acidobacteriaceae bacterium]|nr:methyltransferase domain-containing protein [Acidobacteriaceae bacterium]
MSVLRARRPVLAPLLESRAGAAALRIWLFARNFFRYPTMLGSVIPSSPFLVNDVLSAVDWQHARVIVEFGPGVGTITAEILRRMHPDATLVAIELNQEFARFLESELKDTRLRVVNSSAAALQTVLTRLGLAQADYIISGVPYTTMSDATRRNILQQCRAALKPDGALVIYQFTGTILPYLRSSFGSVQQRFQPLNILPARIFHCTR